MDDCNEEPCECCCESVECNGFKFMIGPFTAECEFAECSEQTLLLGDAVEVESAEEIEAFDHVLNALLQSFAGPLGPGVRRVVVSESTPDGPITYLDRSVDGDDTPPSMAAND